MEDKLKFKRDNFIKKLVSNSRAILTNQIGLPLGVLKMSKIIYWISNIEPVSDIDLSIFNEYESKTRHFAIGSERLEYNKEYLEKQDKGLDEITAKYKTDIINKCIEIIKHFETINHIK